MVALQMLLVAGALGAEPDAILLNFTQANCAPCRQMEPVLAQLEAAGLAVQNINVPQHPDVAQRFKLTGTPTYVMLVDGRETGRIVGTASAEKLKSLFPAPEGNVRGQSPDGGNYVGQKLNGMFGKGAAKNAPPGNDPFNGREPRDSNVRPVSHEAPAAAENDPRSQAMAATVRLRVEDAQGHGVGTGTIIDTHGDEAVLITCAHIFRESKGKGSIKVDLFYPQPQTVEGKLLEYDLERDIALVTIVSPGMIAVPVAPEGTTSAKGSPAFSVGCDPSVATTGRTRA
jgi:thiol-disulfide isomerase/thioredoxin